MTDNYTWKQLYDLIQEMKKALEHQQSVTRTISRVNYNELMSILTNQTDFKYNRNLKIRLNIQDGIITIILKKKEE